MYHLTFYKDFLCVFSKDVPLPNMEISIGLYDNKETPISIAARMNRLCGHTERFRVYESPSKNLSKKSKLIFQDQEIGF